MYHARMDKRERWRFPGGSIDQGTDQKGNLVVKPPMPGEVELLLLCCRPKLGADGVARLTELLAGGLDWERVLALADAHRVFPMTYVNLKRHGVTAVPDEILESLADRFAENQQDMMGLTAELLLLVSRLEAKGVKTLPFKGPVLAASVYGNVALRPAGDLDLLVKRSDVPAALEVLRGCGYLVRLHWSGQVAKPLQEAAIRRFLYHFLLVDEERDFVVELHFDLSPRKMPYRARPDELIEEASAYRLGGRELRVLREEENLLYLCLHGSKHAWARLEWVAVLSEILGNAGQIDEARLWRLAEKRGVTLPLLLGICICHQLMGTDSLPGLRKKVRLYPIVEVLCDEVVARLGQEEPDQNVQARFQWALCHGFSRKLRWLLHMHLCPEKNDIRLANLRIPGLYYFVRVGRILKNYAAQFFRSGERSGARS